MNRKNTLLILFCFPLLLLAQKAPDLLGACHLRDLEKEPYSAWYNANYSDYEPNPKVSSDLKKRNLKKYSITVFFGSWCGDSKRELPRFTKLLNSLSFPEENLHLIGVDDSVQLYKQSPDHEERGLHIYRVPTFIIYEKNKEIGRIVEYPSRSLELDLENILSGKDYTPNYFTYPVITAWLNQGLLADANISAKGLAGQLRKSVGDESELNSCGYVLLLRGQVKEAITVFRINTHLFPQSANCFDSLGEGYAIAGQKEKAIQAYEMAQKLNPQNENIKKRLVKLKGS